MFIRYVGCLTKIYTTFPDLGFLRGFNLVYTISVVFFLCRS